MKRLFALIIFGATIGLAGCGDDAVTRATTGAATGAVVAGPVGAAAGAALGGTGTVTVD